MSAGPDRIVVEHTREGWRWEYRANGRVLATSAQSYHDRAGCLHALYLVTGLRLDVPKGWRGSWAAPYVKPPVRRYLRDRRRGLIATVWDSPYARQERARRAAADPS